jgi:hypothetical protein
VNEGLAPLGPPHREEIDPLREAVNLVLYLCLVLAAEFVGLSTAAPDEAVAVEVIWGTTVGLTVAHIFAFDVAARLFAGGRLDRSARAAAILQVFAAITLAGLLSLPFLILGQAASMRLDGFLIAAVVGVTAYAVGRKAGRSQAQCLVLGASGVILAAAVVLLKLKLSAH